MSKAKGLLTTWLLIGVAVCGGAWATYVSCPGCIDRTRVNTTCRWMGDTAFPLDLRNVDHQAHLVKDAQLAEELAIRHADAEFGKRFGIEHHGGLIDGGRFRRECLSRMFHAIEDSHDVASEQIRRLFGAVWEAVRVGDGHMTTMRATSYTRWSQQYVGADFFIGIVLFWLIALCFYRVARTNDADISYADSMVLKESA